MAGQLRVDEITDEAGTGSPSFPNGLPVGYAAGGTAPAAGSFTEVPDDVLEPGDPIRSVDILAIKENTEFLFDAASFAVIDDQTFTTSGTWTKPADVNDETDIIVAVLVSGGGSGAHYRQFRAAASGGGVGCSVFVGRSKDVVGSGAVTVGAGGAAVTVTTNTISAGDGNTGGDTTLVFSGVTLQVSGGGGGQRRGTAGSIAGGPKGVGSTTSTIFNVLDKGKDGRGGVSTEAVRPIPVFGGGGANGNDFISPDNFDRTQNRDGGPAFTLFGTTLVGAGGNGGEFTGTDGQVPGGGGGGVGTTGGSTVVTLTSGAGGDGGARILVVRGVTSAATINDTTLLIP